MTIEGVQERMARSEKKKIIKNKKLVYKAFLKQLFMHINHVNIGTITNLFQKLHKSLNKNFADIGRVIEREEDLRNFQMESMVVYTVSVRSHYSVHHLDGFEAQIFKNFQDWLKIFEEKRLFRVNPYYPEVVYWYRFIRLVTVGVTILL